MAPTDGAASPASPSEPQTAAVTDEQIQHCLRMLEGKSDEHKFAGLLMITKLTDVDAERMRAVRRQVVDIVGVAFFLRLLSTKGDGDGDLSSFQVLGVNLIASFCEDPTVALTFTQEKVVRFVLDQLGLLTDPSAPATQDCVSILQGIVQNDEGVELLSQESLVGRVVSTLKKMMRATAGDKEKEAPPGPGEDTLMETLLSGYWTVLQRLSTSPAFWTRLPGYDFEFLCTSFSSASGGIAIQILAVLNALLQLTEDDSAPSELLSSRALSDLRVGVVRFLRAKWTDHERDECLRLVYHLMRQSGVAWTLPGTTLRSQETRDEVSGGKFVLFVLKLVGIEIKLMLDEVELALIQMEEPVFAQVDEEIRQQQEVTRTMAVLPICYGIVEFVIAGIVSSADGELVLLYDILLQLKQSFTDTFTVVLEHLTAVRDFMKTHRYKDLVARNSPTVLQLDAVAFASVRVTSAWLAEDSDTCARQAIDLLPFLVCFKPLAQHEPASNQLGSEPDSDDEEVDSDDEVDAVAEVMRNATRIHEDDAQIDQLHFLLPGLLQISAMPEGGQAIAENVDVLRRILRFCCTLCANISSGEEQFGGIPTLTLCLGILMNLMLLRSSNVEITKSGRAASPLPNAVEWYRALSFLLPVACASGSHMMTDTTLPDDERGEDDRYVMVLHVACVILLIVSNFQDKKTRPCELSPIIGKLVGPFNDTVAWMMAHPPDASSESASDLHELCRGLSLRSSLHQAFLPERYSCGHNDKKGRLLLSR